MPINNWLGGTHGFVVKAFKELGHEVEVCPLDSEKGLYPLIYHLKLRQIKKIETYLAKQMSDVYNRKMLSLVEQFKPDLFFSLNCRWLYPGTLRYIKERCRICTVCWVADNPFDSTRFKYFPHTLKFFDYLFLGDMIWRQNVANLAPQAKIYHLLGAYDPDSFKPVQVTAGDREVYGCNLAFAGSAYGEKAEGVYRSGILAQVAHFGLKIWGDDAWDKQYKYYPELELAFQGDRLDFPALNKMYQIANINLNIPNPQCFTTFQQRLFEIAAAKGFQIVDYRKDIDTLFSKDDVVTFKSIADLKDKVAFFLKNPGERTGYINNIYEKMKDNHTYKDRMQEMLKKIS